MEFHQYPTALEALQSEMKAEILNTIRLVGTKSKIGFPDKTVDVAKTEEKANRDDLEDLGYRNIRVIKGKNLLKERRGEWWQDTNQAYVQLVKLGMHASPLSDEKGRILFNQLICEWLWWNSHRPYYKVWPGIIDCLARLDLAKVPSTTLPVPAQGVLELRMPTNSKHFQFESEGKNWNLQSLLVAILPEKATDLHPYIDSHLIDPHLENESCITLWMDFGERTESLGPNFPVGSPVITYRRALIREELNLEQGRDMLDRDEWVCRGMKLPEEMAVKIFKVAASCLLLSTDYSDGILEPDVLKKHEKRWGDTQDPALIEAAKAKGKHGHKVGASLGVSPHVRGPSPAALYWTGPGRKTPLIRFRKGCVVHEKKITQIPTGHEGATNPTSP